MIWFLIAETRVPVPLVASVGALQAAASTPHAYFHLEICEILWRYPLYSLSFVIAYRSHRRMTERSLTCTQRRYVACMHLYINLLRRSARGSNTTACSDRHGSHSVPRDVLETGHASVAHFFAPRGQFDVMLMCTASHVYQELVLLEKAALCTPGEVGLAVSRLN